MCPSKFGYASTPYDINAFLSVSRACGSLLLSSVSVFASDISRLWLSKDAIYKKLELIV